MLMKRYLIIAVLASLASLGSASAQMIAVKSNALYWASSTPNVGLEYAFGDRWTVELEAGYNPWLLNSQKNMKAKHLLISPEVRYWFCHSFQGNFVGINANYVKYNIGALPISFSDLFINLSPDVPAMPDLTNSRIQGWALGAGLTYGYSFPFARRWLLELTGGLGWWYTAYNQFESRKCGLMQQSVKRHALGLSTLGVSFIYMIK